MVPATCTDAIEVVAEPAAAKTFESSEAVPFHDDTAYESALDKQVAKQDKLRSRLDAEASIGVSAALVGGFALSMLAGAGDMAGATQWVFVLCMSACGSLCLAAVVTTGSIYWAGMHLLSATCETVRVENDMFRRFWKMGALCQARRLSRRGFQAGVVVFFGGITTLVYHITKSGPMSAVVGVFFVLVLVFAVVLTAKIEGFTTTVTATV